MPNRSSSPIRRFVFDLLLPFEKGATARLHVEELLDSGYQRYHFSPEDRRFGTFLTYGILRHWFELTGLIEQKSRIPYHKLDPYVRLLLRLGFFQLYAMEGIPDFAAVSSTINLAKELKLSKESCGFINAVLRAFIRQQKALPGEIETKLPAWWLKRLSSQYDSAAISEIINAYQQIPLLSLRINRLKISRESYCQQLEQAGIPFELSSELPDEVVFLTTPQGDPRSLPGYEEGWFIVQDESSARVVQVLDPEPGDALLELGAAPGTKTTHLAARMQNRGRIITVDSSEARMKKLEENCRRLGVSIVEPVIADGTRLDCSHILVDRLLIDAPCSGSGVIGKHPEILLTLREEDFSHLSHIQAALLNHSFDCLKPGGRLVYSTCSLDRAENQEVIERFLQKHPGHAVLEEAVQILPNPRRDGFYIARILKKE